MKIIKGNFYIDRNSGDLVTVLDTKYFIKWAFVGVKSHNFHSEERFEDYFRDITLEEKSKFL